MVDVRLIQQQYARCSGGGLVAELTFENRNSLQLLAKLGSTDAPTSISKVDSCSKITVLISEMFSGHPPALTIFGKGANENASYKSLGSYDLAVPSDVPAVSGALLAVARSLELQQLTAAGTDMARDSNWIEAALVAHNAHRLRHGAPPLQWSNECAKKARLAADVCVARNSLHHSHHKEYGHGQNAYYASTPSAPAAATDAWYDELYDPGYDFAKPGFSAGTGHFTQVVWKETTYVGMNCDSEGMGFIVANYFPPGNMAGAFEQNVMPEGKSKPGCVDTNESAVDRKIEPEDLIVDRKDRPPKVESGSAPLTKPQPRSSQSTPVKGPSGHVRNGQTVSPLQDFITWMGRTDRPKLLSGRPLSAGRHLYVRSRRNSNQDMLTPGRCSPENQMADGRYSAQAQKIVERPLSAPKRPLKGPLPLRAAEFTPTWGVDNSISTPRVGRKKAPNYRPVRVVDNDMKSPPAVPENIDSSPVKMRKPLLVADWGLSGTRAQVEQFVEEMKVTALPDNVDVAIVPSAVHLVLLDSGLKGRTQLVAHSLNHESTDPPLPGTLTDKMLQECGAEWVLLGQRARRENAGETNGIISQKAAAALSAGMNVICIVGEPSGVPWLGGVIGPSVTDQLASLSLVVGPNEWSRVVIAYEPDSGGRIISAPEAMRTLREMRHVLARLTENEDVSRATRLLLTAPPLSQSADYAVYVTKAYDVLDGFLVQPPSSFDVGHLTAVCEILQTTSPAKSQARP